MIKTIKMEISKIIMRIKTTTKTINIMETEAIRCIKGMKITDMEIKTFTIKKMRTKIKIMIKMKKQKKKEIWREISKKCDLVKNSLIRITIRSSRITFRSMMIMMRINSKLNYFRMDHRNKNKNQMKNLKLRWKKSKMRARKFLGSTSMSIN